ncbi:MAG: hypothetical protein PHC75_06650 [Burkholderiales bacterium]|nr:hypothetical protein [Burkholderiales bacterium]
MNKKIQTLVEEMSKNIEKKEYFFNNTTKIKSPKAWFEELYQAELLTPDNALAIVYIRVLISHDMNNNKYFIKVVNDWLDSFFNLNHPAINTMWFIEEVIRLNNVDLNNKCKKFIITKLSNQKTFNEVVNSIVYNQQINKFIISEPNTVIQILKIIIPKDQFPTISQDVYTTLKLREDLSRFLINSSNQEYLSIILEHLLPYIDTQPVEFSMIDTIDSGYYCFSYGDYLIGFLLDIIDNNSEKENEKLISQLVQHVSSNNTEYFRKTTIFKIIIYIIDKINKYELITEVFNLIKSLEELSTVRYALYHCIIKKCEDTWYEICPNFDNWLSKLEYSEQYKQSCNDIKMLNNLAKQTKLTLLYLFKENNSLYKKLSSDYPYDIHEPIKSFEIKSSTESPNNYLEIFKKSTITDIIEFLNGTKKIPVNTDFPEIHLEEAFNNDFQTNNEKYINCLEYTFSNLTNNKHKSWILYQLSNQIRTHQDSHYIEILDIILNDQNTIINKRYLYAILAFISSIVDNNVSQIMPHEEQLNRLLEKNICLENDTNIDHLAGGKNSISGQCLQIIIKISIEKDNTLFKFANDIHKYKIYLNNPNGISIIGQYLFWLFKYDNFLSYFNKLNINTQNIALSTYFQYSRYVNKEIFNLSLKNNFISTEENIYPYMNHAMYFYLNNEHNYILDLLNEQISNEKIVEAIITSLNKFNDQIIKLNAKNKLFEIWTILIISPLSSNVISRMLYSSNLIDIKNEKELDLFKKTLRLLTLHSIIYENEAVKILFKLLNECQFTDVILILLDVANNSPRTYYMGIEYLDKALKILHEQNFKLLEDNLKNFILLIARLKEINYPVPIKVNP